jgi:hypothetical protein
MGIKVEGICDQATVNEAVAGLRNEPGAKKRRFLRNERSLGRWPNTYETNSPVKLVPITERINSLFVRLRDIPVTYLYIITYRHLSMIAVHGLVKNISPWGVRFVFAPFARGSRLGFGENTFSSPLADCETLNSGVRLKAQYFCLI